jgi:hypothetical protein
MLHSLNILITLVRYDFLKLLDHAPHNRTSARLLPNSAMETGYP